MIPLLPIFGYTRADLQNMGMTRFLLRRDPNLNASPSSIEEPGSKRLTPLRELGVGVSSPQDPDVSGVKSSPVKVSKPRSKIARLPKEIQHNLNALLARDRPYPEILHCLNEQGYPGFNKVNLNAWKKTGFQNWLQTQQPKTKAA